MPSTLGRFANDTSSGVETYLRNAAGAEVFSGGPFNINGRRYTIAASAFANSVYNFDEEQWSQSLALTGRLGAAFDWRVRGDAPMIMQQRAAPAVWLRSLPP